MIFLTSDGDGSIQPAMFDPLTVSVIIPCRNAASTVRSAVRTALAQDTPPLEVLVVDDVSTDDSRELAAAAGARVVPLHERANAGGARNRGIDEARGSVLAFMDADVEMPPDWLTRVVTLLERDPSIVGVGGQILNGRPGLWGDLDWLMNHSEWIGTRARPCHVFPTMAIAYRRSAVGELRFPPSNVGEDMFFARAVQRRTRGQLWFEPEIHILHKHRRLDARQFWTYQVQAGHALYLTRCQLDVSGKILVRAPLLLFLFPHLWMIVWRMLCRGMFLKAVSRLPWLLTGEIARMIGFLRARREMLASGRPQS